LINIVTWHLVSSLWIIFTTLRDFSGVVMLLYYRKTVIFIIFGLKKAAGE